jgi:predicted RNA binding protein YcfA (HicA-like mRNA interferase family)
MPSLPRVNARQVLAALKRAGFVERRSTGGHRVLRHPLTGRIAVVPVHAGDLRPGTLASILDQAGLAVDEFLELLR